MTTAAVNGLQIKVVRLPTWALLVAGIAAVVLVAFAGLVGLGVLLVLSPIVLVAAIVHQLRVGSAAESVNGGWPRPNRPRPTAPLIIEGEYEVIDEPREGHVPRPDTGRR